jgi:methyl-accepting chemotaxis protein
MGFSEEIIKEVFESLADLYIAVKIPYKFVLKDKYRPYTSNDVRNSKYWSYGEMTEKILLQFGFAETHSGYIVYSEDKNWYFLVLTEWGTSLAREIYLRRFENNTNLIQEQIKRYNYLCPVLYFGASYDFYIKRYFVNKNSFSVVGKFLDFKLLIDAKSPPPPIKQRTLSTMNQHWKKLKGLYEQEALDIVSLAFQSVALTKSVSTVINEFFLPLYQRRLVLLIPGYNSKRVDIDSEQWIITEEIMEKIKNYAVKINFEKLKEFVAEYISILLVFLGSRQYTKSDILKALEVILEENKELRLSYDEVLERLRDLIGEISSSTGSISRFNEYGGAESPPFMVMDGERLNEAMMEYLELLGSRALALA